jgi:hypothetical protein
MQRSSIVSNKLNGVLARDGAELDMTSCTVQGNGGYGVQLQVWAVHDFRMHCLITLPCLARYC